MHDCPAGGHGWHCNSDLVEHDRKMTGAICFLMIWAVVGMAGLVREIVKNTGAKDNGKQSRAEEFYQGDCASCD